MCPFPPPCPSCHLPRPQVLSKYGALWQHMFRLRRVQLALEGAWATLQVARCCFGRRFTVLTTYPWGWASRSSKLFLFSPLQCTYAHVSCAPCPCPSAPLPQAMQHRKPEDDSLPRLPASLRAALWLERQQQHHFVSNMALYLSMDVVDASFAQLRGAIAAARDFSAADAAHRQYVDSLVSQVRGCVVGSGGTATALKAQSAAHV